MTVPAGWTVAINDGAAYNATITPGTYGGPTALVAAWVVVPLLLDSRWALRTQYNVGTFWFDSYGGAKVFGWLVTGKVFDGSGQTGGRPAES